MEFLLQIIQLLSEPPGNIIYHLVTLLALQVVFALSYSRWRIDLDDTIARRLMWASAAIFLSRFLLLIAGLIYAQDPIAAATALPPLEQAVYAATAAFLVWSLVPRQSRRSRLWDILLTAILVLIGVFYLFSVQNWNTLLEAGLNYYSGTTQAVIWAVLQITILIGGLVFLLLNSKRREPLPIIILGILLVATIIHLWNYAELIPTDTNVPYWTRLGYLIVFPLWAVYAYEHYLTPLLASQSLYQASVHRFGSGLDEAAEVIATRQRERRISKSLAMSTHLLDAAFASIGTIDQRSSSRINFTSSLPEENSTSVKQWALDLAKHPTLNAAFIQGQTIELLPTGTGARQLYDFYAAFDAEPLGPLLIHPLQNNGSNFGLMVIAARKKIESWADEHKAIMPGLSRYIAQAVVNSDLPAVRYAPDPPQPEPRQVVETVPSAIFLDQVMLSSLQAERDELQSALEEAVLRRKQSEEKALIIQKQARYLAAALRVAQESTQQSGANQDPGDAAIHNEVRSRQSDEFTDP